MLARSTYPTVAARMFGLDSTAKFAKNVCVKKSGDLQYQVPTTFACRSVEISTVIHKQREESDRPSAAKQLGGSPSEN